MTQAADPTPPTDADAVRADIEATRAELADTVDALRGKLDVKSRAAHKVSEAKQTVGTRAARANDSVASYRSQIIGGAAVAVVALLIIRRFRGRSS